MRQPNKHLDAHLDDLVALGAAHIRDEAHAAVVVLVARIIETLRRRQARDFREILHRLLVPFPQLSSLWSRWSSPPEFPEKTR